MPNIYHLIFWVFFLYLIVKAQIPICYIGPSVCLKALMNPFLLSLLAGLLTVLTHQISLRAQHGPDSPLHPVYLWRHTNKTKSLLSRNYFLYALLAFCKYFCNCAFYNHVSPKTVVSCGQRAGHDHLCICGIQ